MPDAHDSGGKPSLTWRYQAEPPPVPQLTAEQAVQETQRDQAWFRLQILHTPFRATSRSEYLGLTAWLKKLEEFFLEHPAFEAYYLESFAPETDPPSPDAALPPSAEIDHIAANQAHFMEEVFFGLQLERYANAPDNRGWMNLFRRWGRSPTFNRRFDTLRSTLALNFLDFYDFYLRFYPCRIDEHPIPHPWDREERRKDLRDPDILTPSRTGGEPGPCPTSLAEPARRKEEPRRECLPGLYLDSGLREARTHPPRTVEQAGTGGHGVEDAKGGTQGYETPSQPPSDAGPAAPGPPPSNE
jgi:hypothetical protein